MYINGFIFTKTLHGRTYSVCFTRKLKHGGVKQLAQGCVMSKGRRRGLIHKAAS